MSRYDAPRRSAGRAVALSYNGDSGAPVVVASGMGYLAEKIVEVATENGVPVYEDNSLATVLTQLRRGAGSRQSRIWISPLAGTISAFPAGISMTSAVEQPKAAWIAGRSLAAAKTSSLK